MTSLTRTLLPAGLAALCVAMPLGAQRDDQSGTQRDEQETTSTTSTGFRNTGGNARVSSLTVADRQAGAITDPIILIEGRTPSGDVVTRVRKALVNPRGDVALEAELASGSIGIFSSRGGRFDTVAKSDDYFGSEGFGLQWLDDTGTIVFSTARGGYHRPADGIEPVHLPGHNQHIRFAHQVADRITVADASGLYRGRTNSEPAPVLRTGDRAPGLPDPIRFGGVARIHESRGNNLIFTGNLEGVREKPALFLLGTDGVELAARPASHSTKDLNEVIRARVNAQGDIVLYGNGRDGARIYYGRPGNLTPVDDDLLPLDGTLSILNDGRFIAANNKRISIGRPGSIQHHDLPADVRQVRCHADRVTVVEHRPSGDMFIHTGLPSDLDVTVRSGDKTTTPDGRARTVTNREPRVLSASNGYLLVELTLERGPGETKDPIGIFALQLGASTGNRAIQADR